MELLQFLMLAVHIVLTIISVIIVLLYHLTLKMHSRLAQMDGLRLCSIHHRGPTWANSRRAFRELIMYTVTDINFGPAVICFLQFTSSTMHLYILKINC